MVSLIPKRNGGDRYGENSQNGSKRSESSTERWRPSRREPGEDDKFKDFRAEKPGYQRYNAAEARRHNIGRSRYNERHHDEDEAVPEWMTDGADTMYDTLDLDNCVLPEDQAAKDQERNSHSPELVPFDFGGGGIGAKSPDSERPKGLDGFDSKELDDLIGQIPGDLSDDDEPLGGTGQSRFSSFFNKSTQLERNPSPRMPNIDPSVWGPPPQISPQVPPPDRNIIDQMSRLTGTYFLENIYGKYYPI